MNRYIFIVLLTLGMSLSSLAQKEVRQQVRKGNSAYQKKEWSTAEIDYRKALELNQEDKVATYNLGNTLYRTERGEEAGKMYEQLIKNLPLLSPDEAADVTHNAGNLMLASKQYEQAIELYKESLRRRPTDEETRYNLALAQKLLERQKQEGGGGDENQQEQEQEQNEDKQQEQQEQQQQQEQSPNQQQKPQEPQETQSEQMSQDNAEQILDAFLQDEKRTQEKIEKIKQQQKKGQRSRQKNW